MSRQTDCQCSPKKIQGNPFIGGHCFERLALANHFTQNEKKICPVCGSEITNIKTNEQLALRIQNEFVKMSDENAKYFERIRKELHQNYSDLIGKPVIPQEGPCLILDGEKIFVKKIIIEFKKESQNIFDLLATMDDPV